MVQAQVAPWKREHALALWFDSALLPGGWAKHVRFQVLDGRIVHIATETPLQSGDEPHRVAIPGLCNLHSHAFQRGMAGLAEIRGPSHDNFWTWRDVMYRFVGQLGPDELKAIAALAYMEMLESGFTRVGEFHYLHHPAQGWRATPEDMLLSLCAAAADTGIGFTLLPSFYAHSGFAGLEPTEGQRPFILSVDRYASLLEHGRAAIRPLPGAVLGIAPHSLRAVSPAELNAILPLAAGGPVHIHAAEQTAEVDACLSWSGLRPVQWLLEHTPIDETWCVIHATHMTAAETERLAATGAVAGLCPVTEANLGDGVFPALAFLQNGRIGVGTDSNVLINAREELRMLEYAQRLSSRSRNVLAQQPGSSNGGDLFRAAIQGGAQAVGVPAGLAQGSPADIVSLNCDHASLLHREEDALLDSFIFACATSPVDCVWRHGRKLVKDGVHLERQAILSGYRAAITSILA